MATAWAMSRVDIGFPTFHFLVFIWNGNPCEKIRTYVVKKVAGVANDWFDNVSSSECISTKSRSESEVFLVNVTFRPVLTSTVVTLLGWFRTDRTIRGDNLIRNSRASLSLTGSSTRTNRHL
ncbi:hypothetical protein RRG08_042996 [Elysia crispata]|uniref:Uncharacterized protein n=1 Tax=Elysia crispata TaxID=231223 RepID=A0AAE0XY70_9GAST|nr:hypothetical protein RRG08_042996 [Elysia crispata]